MDGDLKALMEISPDAIVIADKNGRILDVNSALSEILGYAREEVVGQSVEFLVPARLRQSHTAQREEYTNAPHIRSMGTGTKILGLSKEGTEVPVDIKLVPHSYRGEACIIAFMRDISHVERLQSQVAQYTEQLEKLTAQLSVKNVELDRINRIKNQFIGMVAHDLRNPLGAVLGYTKLLLQETPALGETEKQLLSRLHSMSANMLQMVNELLDIDAIESGKVKLETSFENLTLLTRECVDTAKVAAAVKNINIVFDQNIDVPLIEMDAQRIRRVLDNYLSNATKFSPKESKVQICVDMQPSEVKVVVRDNGPGLTEEEQKIVFEPFERASNRPTEGEGSTGLGLAIVKRFVEAHGGRVGVKSSKGEWTEFFFTLPIR